MEAFGSWITYVIIWVLICLIIIGGIVFIGSVSGHVDKTNTGGVAGRTLARYARENEQWIQNEAIPNFLWIFFFGGLIAVFGFIALFVGQDKAAAIVVNTVVYGGIALIAISFIACIIFAIWAIIALFSSNEDSKEVRTTKVVKENYAEEKSKQDVVKKIEKIVPTVPEDDYSDEDWD